MQATLKNTINNILEGNASVEEVRYYLSQIDDHDLRQVIPEDRLYPLLADYKKQHHVTIKPIPHVTTEEREEIWQVVIASSDDPLPFNDRISAWLKNLFAELYASLSNGDYIKYGMAAAVILLIFISPVVFQDITKSPPPEYRGIKGDAIGPQATLQFSIVGSDQILSRPDRPLTEKDTIAFRITAEKSGYGSIYIIHKKHIDHVVSDILLSQGSRDLDVGYSLKGNQGRNILVMLFSEAPIPIAEKEKRKLIIEASRNNVSSMVINKNTIRIVYESIDVK